MNPDLLSAIKRLGMDAFDELVETGFDPLEVIQRQAAFRALVERLERDQRENRDTLTTG
jgi:hypothetical protein